MNSCIYDFVTNRNHRYFHATLHLSQGVFVYHLYSSLKTLQCLRCDATSCYLQPYDRSTYYCMTNLVFKVFDNYISMSFIFLGILHIIFYAFKYIPLRKGPQSSPDFREVHGTCTKKARSPWWRKVTGSSGLGQDFLEQ